MSDRLVRVLQIAGVAVFVLALIAQLLILPSMASSLASSYPEAAHLRMPMTILCALCLVPIQIAAILSLPLSWSATHHDNTSRASLILSAMTFAFVGSAAIAVAILVWLGAQTVEFGMQPGVAMSIIALIVACLGVAALLWRLRPLVKRDALVT